MSYFLDPPALFLIGIVLLLLQKFFNIKYKAVAVIGMFVAFVLLMGGSTLLYLDVIRWPFPDTQGSVWMFHTNYTGIRKEDVPVPLVAAMVLIYPIWLYLGYVVAERLAKRRLDRVLQQSPSHTVSGEKLAVGSIRLNMS
ncbi:MAG: hypothetical protein OEW84_08125 [Aigarchaeota archaeon]|nr:hypothetical protein [Aigarchaeota archaeon]